MKRGSRIRPRSLGKSGAWIQTPHLSLQIPGCALQTLLLSTILWPHSSYCWAWLPKCSLGLNLMLLESNIWLLMCLLPPCPFALSQSSPSSSPTISLQLGTQKPSLNFTYMRPYVGHKVALRPQNSSWPRGLATLVWNIKDGIPTVPLQVRRAFLQSKLERERAWVHRSNPGRPDSREHGGGKRCDKGHVPPGPLGPSGKRAMKHGCQEILLYSNFVMQKTEPWKNLRAGQHPELFAAIVRES